MNAVTCTNAKLEVVPLRRRRRRRGGRCWYGQRPLPAVDADCERGRPALRARLYVSGWTASRTTFDALGDPEAHAEIPIDPKSDATSPCAGLPPRL